MEGKADAVSQDPGIWAHYEDVTQTRHEVESKAMMACCDAVFASPNELQLDLDTPEAEAHFDHQWNWAISQLDWLLDMNAFVKKEVSKSGRCHATIRLAHPLDAGERILLQALLGSDLKRELLNYTRLKTNGDALVCLWRPKPKMLTDGGAS